MIVYHYTHLEKWDQIKEGRFGFGPGLYPPSFFGRYSDSLDGDRAIFALPEPIPSSWADNRDFPNAWERLKKHIGVLLLELTITPRDVVRVADQALVYPGGETLTQEELQRLVEEYRERDRRYLESQISLEEYFRNPSQVSLPEILICNPIPMARIRISDHQPLIEEVIEYGEPALRILRHAQAIPELHRWVGPCEAALFGGRGKEAV